MSRGREHLVNAACLIAFYLVLLFVLAAWVLG